jgi:DNA-binding NtrC family response regulator
VEREAILAALHKTSGHHQKAADLLGISRRTLTRKLKLYRADPKEDSIYAY